MIGVVMMAGCKKENEHDTLFVKIDKGGGNIDDLALCWHNNDLVKVNNLTYIISEANGLSARITKVLDSSHYIAIYPADIVNYMNSSNKVGVDMPDEQRYIEDESGDQMVGVPMGASSSNRSLTFHPLCSLVKVVVTNRKDEDFVLSRITLNARTANLSGGGSVTLMGSRDDKIVVKNSNIGRLGVSLVFPAANRPIIGNGGGDSYVYYIVVPSFGEDDVTITLLSTNTNGRSVTVEKRMSLQPGGMETVNLTVEKWDGEDTPDLPSVDGVLPGAFSVSKTQKVFFSQGNLQYQASTDTWRFAEHQYDFVGKGNDNISSTYSGWIDLFGWGTGNNPTLTSQDTSDYSTFTDWCSNAIVNGGNSINSGWRTLTCAEWRYLLLNRNGAASKVGTGRIDGVGGLVILPDWWTLPSGCTFTPGYDPWDRYGRLWWSKNRYTLTQWEAMEAAGAVFLPAAGGREGEFTWSYEEEYGNCLYWSSTPYDHSGYAYSMMADGLCILFIDTYTYFGFSVRPVR